MNIKVLLIAVLISNFAVHQYLVGSESPAINPRNVERSEVSSAHLIYGDNLNNLGLSPLHTAALSGDVEKIRSLLSSGVNIESKDRFQGTPLHPAAKGGHVEAIREYF